jgi:hypothetical protein
MQYRNDVINDTCTITQTFGNTPWLQNQKEYYVAISRFCVPLHSVPIIAAMPAAIEIWTMPPDDTLGGQLIAQGVYDFNAADLSGVDQELIYAAHENGAHNAHLSIDIPACDTVYALRMFLRNKFQTTLINMDPHGGVVNNQPLSDMVRILLGPDYKFSVLIHARDGNGPTMQAI